MKITKRDLSIIFSMANQEFKGNKQAKQLDNQEHIVLCYLKAIECRLGIKVEYDLPTDAEVVNDED